MGNGPGIARYLVEAHLREGRSVAELAHTHGVHRSWLYKLLARYRREGERGLVPRSRRPHRSPGAMPAAVAAAILGLRDALGREGLDAGAITLHWHLARQGGLQLLGNPLDLGQGGLPLPSVASIWRLLRRSGRITAQPHKRPRSSWIRFQAALPNELWQVDATHWTLADGSACEIVNTLDDCTRLLCGSLAFRTVRAADAVAAFHQAAARLGYPAALLRDNAAVFAGTARQGKVVLESELERLGIRGSHARPYHPQTCGKVERFHQTQKRWLRTQPQAATLGELASQLDRFRFLYNVHRPHRALGRQTPQEAYDAKVKATPGLGAAPVHYRVRYDRIDQHGKVTLRYDSRLRHIGVGARYKRQAVVLLIADRHVRIVNADGELIRELVIDPTRNYQRQSA